MRGGGNQGCNEQITHEDFTVFDKRMGIDDLDTSGAQAFDLPALQSDTCLEAIFNEKVVTGFFIERDGIAAGGFFLRRHPAHYTEAIGGAAMYN